MSAVICRSRSPDRRRRSPDGGRHGSPYRRYSKSARCYAVNAVSILGVVEREEITVPRDTRLSSNSYKILEHSMLCDACAHERKAWFKIGWLFSEVLLF